MTGHDSEFLEIETILGITDVDITARYNREGLRGYLCSILSECAGGFGLDQFYDALACGKGWLQYRSTVEPSIGREEHPGAVLQKFRRINYYYNGEDFFDNPWFDLSLLMPLCRVLSTGLYSYASDPTPCDPVLFDPDADERHGWTPARPLSPGFQRLALRLSVTSSRPRRLTSRPASDQPPNWGQYPDDEVVDVGVLDCTGGAEEGYWGFTRSYQNSTWN